MKILVVGSGGREHALALKLSQDAGVEVLAAPGNPGIAEFAPCFPIAATSLDELAVLAISEQVDLVVVGPEDPLVLGLADMLRSQGIAVFGPSSEGAKLEGSKAFSKAIMEEAGVPTAEGRSFQDAGSAKDYIRSKWNSGRKVVIKASGNALGKGVIVAETLEEAIQAVDDLKALGEAGDTLVVEDRLFGREFSLLTLVNGSDIFSLPVAQDYKRIFDGDQGPNTGGMGTYSPVPWIKPEWVEASEDKIVRPAIQALRAKGIDYRGVLFSGIMVENDAVFCLEYNVRFGDPETQSVMNRIGSGLSTALLACALGEPIPALPVLDNAACTVVVASEGYPGPVVKGREIAFGTVPQDVTVYHAGTSKADKLTTSGGRVLGITATATTLAEARSLAYEGVSQVCFEGMQFRTDIALRVEA